MDETKDKCIQMTQQKVRQVYIQRYCDIKTIASNSLWFLSEQTLNHTIYKWKEHNGNLIWFQTKFFWLGIWIKPCFYYS